MGHFIGGCPKGRGAGGLGTRPYGVMGDFSIDGVGEGCIRTPPPTPSSGRRGDRHAPPPPQGGGATATPHPLPPPKGGACGAVDGKKPPPAVWAGGEELLSGSGGEVTLAGGEGEAVGELPHSVVGDGVLDRQVGDLHVDLGGLLGGLDEAEGFV